MPCADGMQSFAINTARAINRAWGREGAVFAFRYHATQIRTSRYARNATAYVLGNWRWHREDFMNGRLIDSKLDPYSERDVVRRLDPTICDPAELRAAAGIERADRAAPAWLAALRAARS